MSGILVAGATGTNGRELLRQLEPLGWQVRALVRDKARAAELAGGNIELLAGDLGRPDSLQAAFKGVDKAYFVTAIDERMVSLFSNFCEAAAQAGVGHVVKISGYGASADSPSRIIRQHYESDRMLIDSGLGYTILRPNSFYQNMFWQAQSIHTDGRFYLAAGDARQSMIDVRDIAEATVEILTGERHLDKVYNLTGPESLNYDDVARILSRVTGRSVAYVPVSEDDVRESLLSAGMPGWNADALAEIQSLFGSGSYAPVEPDLAGILGRPPRSFERFAQDFAGSFGA